MWQLQAAARAAALAVACSAGVAAAQQSEVLDADAARAVWAQVAARQASYKTAFPSGRMECRVEWQHIMLSSDGEPAQHVIDEVAVVDVRWQGGTQLLEIRRGGGGTRAEPSLQDRILVDGALLAQYSIDGFLQVNLEGTFSLDDELELLPARRWTQLPGIRDTESFFRPERVADTQTIHRFDRVYEVRREGAEGWQYRVVVDLNQGANIREMSFRPAPAVARRSPAVQGTFSWAQLPDGQWRLQTWSSTVRLPDYVKQYQLDVRTFESPLVEGTTDFTLAGLDVTPGTPAREVRRSGRREFRYGEQP